MVRAVDFRATNRAERKLRRRLKRQAARLVRREWRRILEDAACRVTRGWAS